MSSVAVDTADTADIHTVIAGTATANANACALPVTAPLAGLLPGGALRRGWTVSSGGVGATSLALALVAGASAAGSWTAVVGYPGLGLAAAAEAGVALERLLLVAVGPTAAAEAVAALVGSVDVVLVGPGVGLREADGRRLAARLRERGSVLIHIAGNPTGTPAGAEAGAEAGADLRLQVVRATWSGLGNGYGRLRGRHVTVRATGRATAGRPRTVDLLLPGPAGSPEIAGSAAGSAIDLAASSPAGSLANFANSTNLTTEVLPSDEPPVLALGA